MKYSAILLLATVAILRVHSQDWYQYDYNHNLLTFSWPGEFCSQSKDTCIKGWNTPEGGIWDGSMFTLHGFWPGGSVGYLGRDPRCLVNKEVDMLKLFGDDKQMMEDLKYYWPQLDRKESWDWLYIHEWEMHGNCYMMIQVEKDVERRKEFQLNKKDYEEKVMKAYYRDNIKRAKIHNFQFKRENYDNLEQFAEDIGFRGKESHFYLNLLWNQDENKYYVFELKICYSVSSIPAGEVTIPCPYRVDYGNPPFVLRNPWLASPEL